MTLRCVQMLPNVLFVHFSNQNVQELNLKKRERTISIQALRNEWEWQSGEMRKKNMSLVTFILANNNEAQREWMWHKVKMASGKSWNATIWKVICYKWYGTFCNREMHFLFSNWTFKYIKKKTNKKKTGQQIWHKLLLMSPLIRVIMKYLKQSVYACFIQSIVLLGRNKKASLRSSEINPKMKSLVLSNVPTSLTAKKTKKHLERKVVCLKLK